MTWIVYSKLKLPRRIACLRRARRLYRKRLADAQTIVEGRRADLAWIDNALADCAMLRASRDELVLIVVRANDANGKAVSTSPMSQREAIMKVWEFKTSGHTQIRTFNAATSEEVNIVRKPN